MPILIAYASRYGATREIAETIGRVLRERGNAVDVRPAGEVARLEGTAPWCWAARSTPAAGWRTPASLLESFQEDLRALPVWLFSSGPTVPGDPVEALGGWVYPEELRGLVAAVQPLDIALFAGKIDPDVLNLQDWLINRSMRGVSGDFRNFARVEAWATHIADRLEASVVGADGDAGRPVADD